MDYHKDRFEDYSLMVFKDEKLVAVLPANRVEDKLFSHQGLTYGGFVFCENIKDFTSLVDIISQVGVFLKKQNFKSLKIKSIPEFYYKQKYLYNEIITCFNEQVEETKMVFAVDLTKKLTIHKNKLKKYRNNKHHFMIDKSNQFDRFWNNVLIPRLREKHQAQPVHSLAEIKYLSNLFPDNIKQFNIYLDNVLLAGITIFEKDHVVKSQYGATTSLGEKYRALDYLFIHLINLYQKEGKQSFSMGTAFAKTPLGYNPGLKKQKEELGCTIFEQSIINLEFDD